MPWELDRCMACGSERVAVSHALCACEGALTLFRDLEAVVGAMPRGSQSELVKAVFGPGHGAAHVQYVGRALLGCMGRKALLPSGGG